MKFKRWKKLIVMLVIATMFLQSVVAYANDGDLTPATETTTEAAEATAETPAPAETPNAPAEEPGTPAETSAPEEISSASVEASAVPTEETSASEETSVPAEITSASAETSVPAEISTASETTAPVEEPSDVSAVLEEFRALLDQMEVFELTEENQEEYQALGAQAGGLLEILMEDYYGYEGMEDDLLRFQALADRQTGGAEELASSQDYSGNIYAVVVD